jgi:hypothetical protein
MQNERANNYFPNGFIGLSVDMLFLYPCISLYTNDIKKFLHTIIGDKI